MIEETVRDYLAEQMSVPVLMEVPEDPPDSFIVLEKTGSSEIDHIRQATLAIQAYAPTLHQAAQLNQMVKAAMDKAVSLDEIGAVRLNADYNFTDLTMKRYRYQAVCHVTHY